MGKNFEDSIARTPSTPPDHDETNAEGIKLQFFSEDDDADADTDKNEDEEEKGKYEEQKKEENDEKFVHLHSISKTTTKSSKKDSDSVSSSFEDDIEQDGGIPPVDLGRCVDSMYKNMHDNCDFLLKTQWTDFWSQTSEVRCAVERHRHGHRGLDFRHTSVDYISSHFDVSECCEISTSTHFIRTWCSSAKRENFSHIPQISLYHSLVTREYFHHLKNTTNILHYYHRMLRNTELALRARKQVLWIEYFGDALRRMENETFLKWVDASVDNYVVTAPFVFFSILVYLASNLVFCILSMQCCKKDRQKNLRQRRLAASIKLASSLVILFFVLAACCIFLIYAIHRETWGEFFLGTLIAAVFLALFAQSNTLSLFKGGNIPLFQAFLLVLVLYLGPVLYMILFSLFSEENIRRSQIQRYSCDGGHVW